MEFDTQLSADGIPVLMHDDTVDRTTRGQGLVGQMTCAELRQLDIGGEPVPLLTEALQACAALGLWANIELKAATGCDERDLARQVGDVLGQHWNRRGIVSSFSETALMEIKTQSWWHGSAWLIEVLPDDWRERARRLGACALHLAAEATTPGVIEAVQSAGLPLACYTVNQRPQAEALLSAGVTAVFTDHPEFWAALPADSGKH